MDVIIKQPLALVPSLVVVQSMKPREATFPAVLWLHFITLASKSLAYSTFAHDLQTSVHRQTTVIINHGNSTFYPCWKRKPTRITIALDDFIIGDDHYVEEGRLINYKLLQQMKLTLAFYCYSRPGGQRQQRRVWSAIPRVRRELLHGRPRSDL